MRGIKYKVDCPFSNRPQDVHVYFSFVDGSPCPLFTGCDTFMHQCPECDEMCRSKALRLFAEDVDAGRLSREQRPKEGFPDLNDLGYG